MDQRQSATILAGVIFAAAVFGVEWANRKDSLAPNTGFRWATAAGPGTRDASGNGSRFVSPPRASNPAPPVPAVAADDAVAPTVALSPDETDPSPQLLIRDDNNPSAASALIASE
jgi:hypothetical protein